MTPAKMREIVDAVQRACPDQKIAEDAAERWRPYLKDLRASECLVAVAMLGCFQLEIQPADIQGRVLHARKHAYEPSGQAWRENLERHGGEEYMGGPVDPW